MENVRKYTPSEYYKMRRPEYFSDSTIDYETTLPKEQAAFELSKITTNQKQDEFETLCRKLVEKTIAPNLMPQVGPTGGGDGKTDSETYPVSTSISERWFIPEKGWNKGEKWAFAFSAKKTWKSKAKSDIEKIIGTNREFTRIYFITNQTPSSKKRKNAQDEFAEQFGLDIVLLDGKWILEKVYDNDLLEIFVDSLNLSDSYKNKKISVGENDAKRTKRLKEIEENIQNPNRYFEYDFQLVEDALEAAVLSRKLEKPRDEIEGKFDRAFRFCKKLDLDKQWIRLHYQRAWTYLYYFDDYSLFIDEFEKFKNYISIESSISEIELYVNLFNSLRSICAFNDDMTKAKIDFSREKNYLYELLYKIGEKENKPCSSLMAKMYISFQNLMDSISDRTDPSIHLSKLTEYFNESRGLLDFPFESFRKMVQEIGSLFPNNKEYDEVIDVIASISEDRSSELSSGETYLKRGMQKLKANYYKESIIFLGKAVHKLAKEESENGLYAALAGLGHSFKEMGLIWASNNCFVSAGSISFKSWFESVILDKRVYDCIKNLAINEQIIGRIPNFIIWHELFEIVSRQIEEEDNYDDEIPIFSLLDGCLSVRLMNTKVEENGTFSFLPDLLARHSLFLSEDASLFKLGYTDLIIDNYKDIGINNEDELEDYFGMVANQPFRDQMLYESNFLSESPLQITSKILGCNFVFTFKKDPELLLAAETLAAFFENFFSTSLSDVFPSTEAIFIELIRNPEVIFNFSEGNSSSEYTIEIDKFDFTEQTHETMWGKLMEFTGLILTKNFMVEDPKKYLENLFTNEEISERLTFIFQHRNFFNNILGDNQKLFFEDWIEEKSFTNYSMKRDIPLIFDDEKGKNIKDKDETGEFDFEKHTHKNRNILSIIDIPLWEKANWKGFGTVGTDQGFGIFLGYENIIYGKKIFENWIRKLGSEDKEERIKISIIMGIDENNPFWYKVLIGSNLLKDDIKPGNLFVTPLRIHEMNPRTPDNLNKIIEMYNKYQKFRFFPAELNYDTREFKPIFSRSIIKKELNIKNAWEIGLHDVENVIFKKGDRPIIPDGVENAPVLEILRKWE